MQKFLLIGAVAVVGLGALLLAATLTGSDSVAQANNGAVVINDQGCALLDGDGNSISTSESHAVITNSKNGNTLLKCSVKGVANSTGKAVHFDFDNTGITCATNSGSTENWHETVSASGNATLTCRIP
jgi:hypothetical protein